MRRVPTYYSDLEEIIGQNPGHVIGSSACLGGYLPKLVLESENPLTDDKIYGWINYMKRIFGDEDFYLEMQPSFNEEQIEVNKTYIELAKKTKTKFIITTDSHYARKEDAPVHKAYLNSQDGDREVDSFYASTYMMDTEELESYFEYFNEDILSFAYSSIREIKDKCQDYSLLKPLRIPELKWKKYNDYSFLAPTYYSKIPELEKFVKSDYEGDRILANAIIDKLEKNKEEFDNKKTYDAINVCLDMTWESSIINKTHWSAYYLNLQNIIDACWAAGSIVGPGRGSGVGFILLYILDIIQINCLRETTITQPWRFLNPSRVSVLD